MFFYSLIKMASQPNTGLSGKQAVELLDQFYQNKPCGGTRLKSRISKASGKDKYLRAFELNSPISLSLRDNPQKVEIKDITSFPDKKIAKKSPMYEKANNFSRRTFPDEHRRLLVESRRKPGQSPDQRRLRAKSMWDTYHQKRKSSNKMSSSCSLSNNGGLSGYSTLQSQSYQQQSRELSASPPITEKSHRFSSKPARASIRPVRATPN